MRYFSSKSVCRNSDSAVVLLRANLMLKSSINIKLVIFTINLFQKNHNFIGFITKICFEESKLAKSKFSRFIKIIQNFYYTIQITFLQKKGFKPLDLTVDLFDFRTALILLSNSEQFLNKMSMLSNYHFYNLKVVNIGTILIALIKAMSI
ncbi:hypothetical protein BpHYR1_038946 [Brachionus plicatilis]|uniref:Uncharacterized protein n=1 Tax=Brachionus plicatilis TaxID=10195 RepID=A0A3M7PMV4_BRAPC|nr:hypothetical protein BpHYR1_038946 [Brachionus plicatilis]